jgi:hypothetical protein
MLGSSSKPIPFDPYGRRRSRRGLPRWLVLLLIGGALGAGSVLLVQERYLPARLSAQESATLRQSFARAEADRVRLQSELGDTNRRLQTALADKQRADDEAAASRSVVERLRGDVASLVASLPPDPRGGPVEVRAARFTVQDGALAYDVVLSRERAGKPFTGVMQFVVAGDSGKGSEQTVALKPVAVSVGPYESLRGSVPLPEGFKPRQTTINVLDRVDGKRSGMRVVNVSPR